MRLYSLLFILSKSCVEKYCSFVIHILFFSIYTSLLFVWGVFWQYRAVCEVEAQTIMAANHF